MTEYKSITIFKLLRFRQENNLIHLNRSTPSANGFNNEVHVGIFQMIGYNKEHKQLLIKKPINDNIPNTFILYETDFDKLFEELLTFTIFNN